MMTEDQSERHEEQIQLLRQMRRALQSDDTGSAIELMQRLATLTYEAGDLGAAGRHLGNLALLYYRQGQPDEALDCFGQALDLVREDEDRLSQSGLLGNIGNIFRELHRLDEATAYLQEALNIAEELNDKRGRGIWVGNLGLAYDDLKLADEALACHLEAVKIARELRDKRGLASRLGNLGNSYVSRGDPEQALIHFEESATLYQELGDQRRLAVTLGMMANLHSELGRTALGVETRLEHFTVVLDLCLRALSLVHAEDDSVTEVKILLGVGDAAVEIGQYDQAIEYYQAAQQVLTRMGMARQVVLLQKRIERAESFQERAARG